MTKGLTNQTWRVAKALFYAMNPEREGEWLTATNWHHECYLYAQIAIAAMEPHVPSEYSGAKIKE